MLLQRIIRNTLLIICFTYSNAYAQYTGGSGRGEASVSSVPNQSLSTSSDPFFGGNGKGDAANRKFNIGLAAWQSAKNSQVLTPYALVDAAANDLFAITNAATLTSTTITVSANTLSATAVVITPTQAGLHAMFVQKQQTQPNQLLVKGDFRSLYINPATGQSQCNSLAGNYTQLLWLDTDLIEVNTTMAYIDKTLTTLYSSGDGTSWYNIKDGKAIKINAAGLITDLCN